MVRDGAPESAQLPMSIDVLYARSYVSLTRLAGAFLADRQLAEDIVQEVFTRIHARQPHLSDPAAADRYLRVGVLNGARNALRTQKRRRARDSAAEATDARLGTTEASAETLALEGLGRRSIRKIVMTLPDRQRDVIFLRYLADLSIAETARTLNISEGAVKASNTRASKALAHILGDPDDD